MRIPRHTFRTILIALVLVYVAAHLIIRTNWCQRYILDTISERTGYDVSASSVRFGPLLAFKFQDLAMSVGEGESSLPIFSARNVRLSRRGGSWCVEASRAEITGYRSEDGVWVPANFQAFGGKGCFVQSFVNASAVNRSFFFDFSDSTLTLHEAGRPVRVFAGLDWSRLPADVPGVRNAVANRLSIQSVRGVKNGCPLPEPLVWLDIGGAIQPISGSQPSAVETDAEDSDQSADTSSEDIVAPTPSEEGQIEVTPAETSSDEVAEGAVAVSAEKIEAEAEAVAADVAESATPSVETQSN